MSVLDAVQSSGLSKLITSEQWLITLHSKQILETLHFLAFSLQIGAIVALSIRLLGLGRGIPIAALGRCVLSVAWLSFLAVFVTGALQFVPIAAEVFDRPSFRTKIALLVVALVVLVFLHRQVRLGAAAWDAGAPVPASLRAAAVMSLLIWPAVIVVARLMYAFVQMSNG